MNYKVEFIALFTFLTINISCGSNKLDPISFCPDVYSSSMLKNGFVRLPLGECVYRKTIVDTAFQFQFLSENLLNRPFSQNVTINMHSKSENEILSIFEERQLVLAESNEFLRDLKKNRRFVMRDLYFRYFLCKVYLEKEELFLEIVHYYPKR